MDYTLRKASKKWKCKAFYHNGYVIITQKKDNKFIQTQEHRLVVESKLGRALLKSEHVHHIDGDKTNNSKGNLIVLSIGQHTSIHKTGSRHSRKTKEKLKSKWDQNKTVGSISRFRKVEMTTNDLAIEIRECGFTSREIASLLGLCKTTILNILNKRLAQINYDKKNKRGQHESINI